MKLLNRILKKPAVGADVMDAVAATAAVLASTQLLASIDLFVYVRALPRAHVEQLISDTLVGRLATVALTRCLVEHAWHEKAPSVVLASERLQRSLMEAWSSFSPHSRSCLADTFGAVSQRRLDPPARLKLAQLEHWCEAAVGSHFAEAKPVRTGWLTYALGYATTTRY